MPNFLTIHKQSNLVSGVVTSSQAPRETSEFKFLPATDKILNILDKWQGHNPGLSIDLGDLMTRSEYLHDYVTRNRVDKSQAPKAKPQRIYYRDEQSEKIVDRLSSVLAWIAENPTADVYQLSDAFSMGTSAAKAYLLASQT
jgi:hypothetical protein